MARIRSVHPSLFTDEAWVSCSPLARVLYIGLMTDADDQGLFEWKPLQIRMRLLPGDNADVAAMLAELEAVNLVARLDAGGKKLGAIRYFRRFQRPKKPNSIFVLPAEWRTYVGLTADGSELPDDEAEGVLPGSEKSPQMEDGGGRREGESEAIASSVAAGDCEEGFEALWKAYPHVKGRSSKPKALIEWDVLKPELRCRLATAARRYAGGGTLPEGGAPALAKWLQEERWTDWLTGASEDAPPVAWRGPREVRDAFVKALGEPWCRSYLDRCGWQDVPERALIPATLTAGKQIVRDARAVLAALGLTVLEQAA